MNASDLANLYPGGIPEQPCQGEISPDTPLTELPSLLAENGMHPLSVQGSDKCYGTLDVMAVTGAIAHILPSRTDCSVIELRCDHSEYSASRIASAVEDVDAHLIDLFTYPEEERLHILLRITHSDPTSAVRSLERYGYTAVSTHSATNAAEDLSRRRINELVQYLNI